MEEGVALYYNDLEEDPCAREGRVRASSMSLELLIFFYFRYHSGGGYCLYSVVVR